MGDLTTALRSKRTAELWLDKSNDALSVILASPSPTLASVVTSTKQVERCLKTWEDIELEVERLVSDEDINDLVTNSFTFKSKIMDTLSKSEDFFQKSPPIVSQPQFNLPNQGSISGSSNSSSQRVKLPVQTLPRFEYEVTEWPPFWEQFVALVHSTDLPIVSKFTYLKGALDGEAARVLKGLSLVESNYDVAINLLKERFGRKDLIIQSHLQSLLKLDLATKSQPGSSGYISSLWNFYDDILSHVRSIEGLGIVGSKCEVFLVPIILSRIPSNICQAWFKLKSTRSREDDLSVLIKFLYDHISELDSTERYRAKFEKDKVKTTVSAASALHVSTNVCSFCKKSNHNIISCYAFIDLDIEDRIKKRKELGLCIKCLKSSHKKPCRNKCSKCLGLHHDLLHRKTSQNVSANANNPTSGYARRGSSDITVGPQILTASTVPVLQASNSAMHSSSVPLSSSAASFAPLSDDFAGINQCHLPNKTVTVLQTARVKVKVSNSYFDATILFDTGSDKSYISSKFSSKIKPYLLGRELISYSAFGESKSTKSNNSKVFSLDIVGIDNLIHNLEVIEVPNICKPLFRQKVPIEIIQTFGVQLADDYQHDRNLNIDILVGMNHYWDLVQPNMFLKKQGLIALYTAVGWILSGSFPVNNNNNLIQSAQLLCINNASNDEIDRFWTLESFGIGPKLSEKKHLKSSHVFNSFSKCIVNIGNRYQVPLVFKENASPDQIVNNKKIAIKRTDNLYKMLDKDPNFRDQYHNIFFNYEREDMIEDVTQEQSEIVPYQPFYLPHRPIVKMSSVSTKIRPVFDGSSKSFNGLSINDLLAVGPSLNPNIVSILLRFRRWLVALLADVKMAFLQIALHPYFRDICRFLLKIGNVYRIMRFKRLPFGLSCSPFILNAVIKCHLSKYEASTAVREIDENMFVDDLITGADSVSEASSMHEECNRIASGAGMVFTKWCSNDETLNLFMNKDSDVDTSKVLGVAYDIFNDTFYFIGFDTSLFIVSTKRSILSFIAKFYDPLGFISPFIMYCKFILQDLWLLELDWDDDIPSHLSKEFQNWLASSNVLKQWQLPRAYFSGIAWRDVDNLEIHGFCDASERGFGAVVYLRIQTGDGYRVSFAIARSRVAPTKKLTLPRLELLGALLLARLVHDVSESLHLDRDKTFTKYYWSDSKVTIAWIKSDPYSLKTFVCNRVTEIQELEATNWIHCPGILNPADLISRGCMANKLIDSDYWLNGPSWLYDPIDFRDLKDSISIGDTDLVSEFSNEVKNIKISCVSALNYCYDVQNYSSLISARKVMAFILRFLTCFKFKFKIKIQHPLTALELLQAERRIVYIEQRKLYAPEISSIINNRPLPKASHLGMLAPILDSDGFLRVGGRNENAALPYESKHPIIVPSGHLSKLMISFQHFYLKHAGVTTVLSTLKDSYWIIRARRTAKSVHKSCKRCQRHDSRPITQPSLPLPSLRVNQCPPFTVSGIDHAGPLFCTDLPSRKFYILLFTCSVVRAVHLELVDSLNLSDCLLAIRRFAARRGMPSIFYSDNAKTFESANRHLQTIFVSHSPQWKFIPPKSPWWGGWWERMVRSVKLCLKKSLHHQKLSRSELETVLHEIEAVINSRPLTYVSDDIGDPKPLTPSHFLLGKTVGSQPDVVVEGYDISSQDLLLNYSLRQKCISLFWKTWSDQYLRNLPPVICKQFHSRRVKEGDLVLVRDENKSRLFWPLGVILKVFLSDDQICRSALVKTAKSTLKRSVNCLHQLECSFNESNASSNASIISSNARIQNETVSGVVENEINNLQSNQNISYETIAPVDLTSSISESSHVLSLVGPPIDVPVVPDGNLCNNENSTSTPVPTVPSHYTTRRGRKVKPVVKLNL